jgi:serine/threonine protein kinase
MVLLIVAGFPRFIPQYVVGGQLGEGGMGVVHLGSMVTPAGERQVAIKRVLAKTASDPAAAERMIAEARLVFRLTHANICQVLDVAQNDDGTFIVMEYVNGLDLHALLGALAKQERLLDVPLCVKVAAEVAEALDFAHHATDAAGQPLGLVHGDVTPRNILVSRDGEVKLADFGVARTLSTLAPGNRLCGGTPGFIAPEVLDGHADQRADLYALGVTLYVALSGRSPQERIDLRALKASRSDVTAELCDILERATTPLLQARFSSAGELEHALTVHLARRFPSVTRASLRDVVRAHTHRRSAAGEARKGDTLKSLTRTDVMTTVFEPPDALPSHEGEPPNVASGKVGRRTERFSAGKHHGVARAVRAVGLVAALAGTLAITWWRRATEPPHAPTPQVAPVGPAVPAASVPPPEAVEAEEDAPPPPEPAQANPKTAATPSRLRRQLAGRSRIATASSVNRAAPREMGYLTVNAVPWGAVHVDGRLVAEETPIYRLPVAAGVHRVTISGNPTRAHASAGRAVTVRAGETQMVSIDW